MERPPSLRLNPVRSGRKNRPSPGPTAEAFTAPCLCYCLCCCSGLGWDQGGLASICLPATGTCLAVSALAAQGATAALAPQWGLR